MWGGHRLETMLNKPVADGDPYAECWEIVDYHTEQSIISSGSFSGRTLNELVHAHGKEILGKQAFDQIHDPALPVNMRGRFPLIFKFLDCNRNLSVQVHPNDVMGATLDPPDMGKTEAWYIIHADPDSVFYSGLKAHVDHEAFLEAVKQGNTSDCLHRVPVTAGDCVMIPAGTVHALGAGLLVAEIQQASDTTFRLYDWDRPGPDGKPRQLHLEKGLQAIDFEIGPVDPVRTSTIDAPVIPLVSCEKFSMSKRNLSKDCVIDMDGRFRLIVAIDGSVDLETNGTSSTLKPFELVLVSAGCERLVLKPQHQCQLLEVWI
jgi:mannose-6-phosphate isomerase